MSTARTPLAPGRHRQEPSGTTALPGSAYEMRSLHTGAERAEAAALVEERLGWLTHRGLPVPARSDVPALFRDPRCRSVGLFEDDVLIGCMILDERADYAHWGVHGVSHPALFLGHVHTLPGHSDDVIRLITLWASDYAARRGLPYVRAEALARHHLSVDPIARFLDRLKNMGWAIQGAGPGSDGERRVRLELPAELRPRLAPLIACTVALPHQGPAGSGGAS
ncbi:MAG TPA: hypothetical protein VFX33_11245 [Actinomycetales bacterium]|nr:hypothetical protein [Actinomycetales bacterium]